MDHKSIHPPLSIQAAVFDLDGVLMNTEWISYLVWKDIAARQGGALDESAYPVMVGLTAEETGEYVMQVSGALFELAPTVAEVWQRVLSAITAGIEPQPGARDLLEALTARGIPLAIASNSPASYIRASLDGLKLAKFFRHAVGVDQVSRGKPAPDLFLRAAELLGVESRLCMAVEDSYVGSQAALAAGMRVAAVPSHLDDPGRFAGCFGVYRSLADLGSDLERILETP